MTQPTYRLVLALVLAAACGHAAALQIGDLRVQSTLGEPFRAVVPILAGVDEAAAVTSLEILPSLDYLGSAPARQLSARMAVADDGAPYAVLTSAQAMQTPAFALRLRVELGREAFIRGFDVALPAARAAAPEPASRGVATTERTVVAAAPSWDGSDTYGPVQPNETLWKIAARVRGRSGMPIANLVATLAQENPQAFVGGNPDRLKVGAVLRIPVPAVADRADAVPAKQDTATVAVPEPAPRAIDADAASAAQSPPAAPAVNEYAQFDTRIAALTASVDAQIAALESGRPAPTAIGTSQRASAEGAATQDDTAPMRVQAGAAPSTARDAARRSIGASLLLALGVVAILAAGIGARRARRHLAGRRAEAVRRQADQARVAALADKVAQQETVRTSGGKVVAMRRRDEPATRAVDPFAEIDINLAYGRYDDAEGALRRILADTPLNHLAKLKLAEVYYVAGRADEFVAVAEDLRRNHRELLRDTQWDNVVEMGVRLAPKHPLFSGPILVDVND
ncbi:MAG: FimV family protein [Gammaproteobacteria bacterium]